MRLSLFAKSTEPPQQAWLTAPGPAAAGQKSVDSTISFGDPDQMPVE